MAVQVCDYSKKKNHHVYFKWVNYMVWELQPDEAVYHHPQTKQLPDDKSLEQIFIPRQLRRKLSKTSRVISQGTQETA